MTRGTFYKYRSLENFEFFIDIIVNERLYASSYENMNDAMEGIYYHCGLKPNILKGIKNSKEKFKICSLSKEKNEPLLWSHYANGSRGINIGLDVTGHNLDIKDIVYTGTPTITDCIDANRTAKEILSYKHESWKYENEVRVFTENNNAYVKIKIKEIILGERISQRQKSLVQKLVTSLLPGVTIIEYKDLTI